MTRKTVMAITLMAVLCGLNSSAESPGPGTRERRVPLQTNILSDDAIEISFSTQPGMVYRIEQSSNSVWKTWERIVADAEKFQFMSVEEPPLLYQVFQEDDRIQFPDWFDRTQQYLRFNVWTPIKGTYKLELYGDGALHYRTNGVVPSHGHFGLHDSSYDPADWPNAGYYTVGLWELRVTVVPANRTDAPVPVTTFVQKIGTSHPRYPVFKKATIQSAPLPLTAITNASRK